MEWNAPPGGQFHGVAFGDIPLEPLADGRFVYEVELVQDPSPEGFAIGVSKDCPETSPEFIDELPNAWLYGFDGFQKVDTSKGDDGWSESKFDPKACKAGDCIGLIVENGNLLIMINGEVLQDKLPGLPKAKDATFFPVIDLMGGGQVAFMQELDPPPPQGGVFG